MRFGVFHLVWASPLTDAGLPALAQRAAAVGADVLEIAVSRDPLPFRPSAARRVLADAGLGATLVTSLSPERDVGSEDPSARARGKEFLLRYLDAAAELQAPVLSGALYGSVWDPPYLSTRDRDERRARCVEVFSKLAPEAQARGVRVALEPLSRFHTSFLNTVAQGRELVEEVGHPAIGLLLDTFQMNIEEKSLGEAIRQAGPRLYHLHASENDRGTPGSGHVAWEEVRDALREVAYDGTVVIEAFNPDVPELAAFLKVWRRLETDQDTLARDGLRFLRGLMGAA